MSDWHRSFVRSGEKPKPVHTRSIQVPASLAVASSNDYPATPPPSREADHGEELSDAENKYIRIREQIIRVDAEINALAGESGRASSDLRKSLLARKYALLIQQPRLKALMVEERNKKNREDQLAYAQAKREAAGAGDLPRALAIIAVLRSIVMDIDEQGPSETEAIRNAGAFLKEHGHLP